MPLPQPIHAVKPLAYFLDGDNIRRITVDDALRELNQSLRQGQLQPIGAIDEGDYGTPIYGFRRLAAARLA